MKSEPRILVVDDEPSNCVLVQRVLTGRGFVIVSASSGEEALDLFRHLGPFDAYILDVMMPNMLGTELAVQIRRSHADARILFFTGYAEELFSSNALRKDETLLTKPATVADIREAVDRLLSR